MHLSHDPQKARDWRQVFFLIRMFCAIPLKREVFSVLPIYSVIDHPDPPGEIEIQVWRPDHSGSKHQVVVRRTYYHWLEWFVFIFAKAYGKKVDSFWR